MLSIKTYERPMAVKLTDADRLEIAAEIGAISAKIAPLELELERYRAGVKATRERIDDLVAEIRLHGRTLAAGERDEQVAHEDRPHPDRPVWEIWRRTAEGWEQVGERPMTAEERQVEIASVAAAPSEPAPARVLQLVPEAAPRPTTEAAMSITVGGQTFAIPSGPPVREDATAPRCPAPLDGGGRCGRDGVRRLNGFCSAHAERFTQAERVAIATKARTERAAARARREVHGDE